MPKQVVFQENAFLKYFFNTYISPCMSKIPTNEEIFKDSYLSAHTVWSGLHKGLDGYFLSESLQINLLKLFEEWENLWESYLCVTTDDLNMGSAFSAWVSTQEVEQH